ncbi:hypothetical protein F4703DRAFT_1874916 [Phycomyces blakesleeanus]
MCRSKMLKLVAKLGNLGGLTTERRSSVGLGGDLLNTLLNLDGLRLSNCSNLIIMYVARFLLMLFVLFVFFVFFMFFMLFMLLVRSLCAKTTLRSNRLSRSHRNLILSHSMLRVSLFVNALAAYTVLIGVGTRCCGSGNRARSSFSLLSSRAGGFVTQVRVPSFLHREFLSSLVSSWLLNLASSCCRHTCSRAHR